MENIIVVLKRSLRHAPLASLLVSGAVASLVIAVAACSGGAGDLAIVNPPGGGGGGGGTNNLPVVASPNPDITINLGSSVNIDGSKGGATFTDPDNDPLSYGVSFNPTIPGLIAANAIITGTPTTTGTTVVTVTASDGRGGNISDSFVLTIQNPGGGGGTGGPTPNLPPVLFDYVGYAETNLPGHFRNGPMANADNTPAGNPISNAGATLGRVLFYDKRLSLNNTVSCGSCHQQQFGFSDPMILSDGFNGGQTGRHSMGLVNTRFYENGRMFWDERATTLEEQALQPIQDAVEMGMTLPALITKLNAETYYPPLFTAAFGDATITSDRISLAIAQFVRSMVSYQSKHDTAFGGGPPDFQAIYTPEEFLGFQLFSAPQPGAPVVGLACTTCHGLPAQVANQPRNNGLDLDTSADQGAGQGRFKVPSLRNVEVRAPFMHDGRFATLRQVIDFYSDNVQNHPNLDPSLRVGGPGGPVRRPNLTNAEKDAMVAFLRTLTDITFLNDAMFSDPFQ